MVRIVKLVIGLVAIVAFSTQLLAQDVPNPISDAKVGEWVLYKMQGGIESKQTVIKREGNKITIEAQTIMNGKPMGPATPIVIDLDAKGPSGGPTGAPPGQPQVKITDGTATVKGKEFKCKVIEAGPGKSWISADFPVNGMIKAEANGQVAMEAVDYGFEGGASSGGSSAESGPGHSPLAGPKSGPSPESFTPDGKFDDWATATKVSDPAGDVSDKGGDITAFAGFRGDGKVRFMVQTAGPIGKDPSQLLHAVFFFVGQDLKYMIILFFDSGQWHAGLFYGDGSETGTMCEAGVSDGGYEVSVNESSLEGLSAPYSVFTMSLTDTGNTPMDIVPDIQKTGALHTVD